VVAAGSFVLEREQAYQQAIGFVTEVLPISQELIERNIQQVLELRGTVGIVGLIGLLWSGTGVFTALAHNVNRAWPEAEPRNSLERCLVPLGMVGTLKGLLVLSLLSTAVISLLPQLRVPLWGGVSIYETPLWALLSNLIPWLSTFLMFLGLYRWVPNTDVKWSGGLLGGVVNRLCMGDCQKRFHLVSQEWASSIRVSVRLIRCSRGFDVLDLLEQLDHPFRCPPQCSGSRAQLSEEGIHVSSSAFETLVGVCLRRSVE
jgi:hypothetical protein